ncbi:hypothetical protein QWJ34_09820 [Saccharibacillus sp. CPCC 101409]|uniref:hypothetical protein n=1 Tax=Saccharibacillus sp. CPCC 101409 TaxID=3058041 RepID=UPI0026734B09|nr:hypothetical protein [Saccharibacillus sp. CPCC 101409]MDO3410057.1 hypothetical protein [Saccharibacillus sp. CPCC 101409]
MAKKAILGPLLILLGAYMLFGQSTGMTPGSIFGYFWASLFILPLGLFFHWMYFSMTHGRAPGLLIPGGLLVTVAIVCQIAMLFGSWDIMWPGFILAPAVGLFEFYWFGGRNRWLLIPINILTVLSLLFFAVFSISALTTGVFLGQPVLVFLLIGAGVLLLLSSRRKVRH